MTPTEIAKKAEQLRGQEIGMGNYKQIVNDVLVLIRELAKQVASMPDKNRGGHDV